MDGHAAAAVERLARAAGVSVAELVQHALKLEEEYQRGPSPEPGRSSQPGDAVVGRRSVGTVVSLPQEPSGARESAVEVLRVAGDLDVAAEETPIQGPVRLANASESDEAYIIKVEMPGVTSEDIAVELAGKELLIKYEQTSKEGGSSGFEYRVKMPFTEDLSGRLMASLADGVLTVTMPKTTTYKQRQQPSSTKEIIDLTSTEGDPSERGIVRPMADRGTAPPVIPAPRTSPEVEPLREERRPKK